MKNRIVVDTSVFIAGWFEDDEDCKVILSQIYDKEILPLFSQETMGELVYVIKSFARHTFDTTDLQITFLAHLMEIIYWGHSINTMDYEPEYYCEDPYDQMFWDCAVVGKAKYIITKDIQSGLLEMTDYESNLEVLTPSDYCKQLS